MAITNFQEVYVDMYQDTFHKVLVGNQFANFRLQANISQGDTVHRFAVDLSSVQVRTITSLTDRTVDAVTNTDETLLIDKYEGTTFPISQFEKTMQRTPALPMLYGKEAAIKVKEHVDATILAEVRNADNTFDTGDLTTTTSNGTPITLSTTTVPQMVAQADAKLKNNQVHGGNKIWIVDPYGLSMINQTEIGRDTTLGDATYKNGRSGQILGSDVYVSDNLTGEAVLGMATQPSADETVVIKGVTFTFKAAPAAAGEVDLGADVDGTRANLEAAINGGSGAGSDYIEVSTADRATLTAARITATNDDTANTLTCVGIGAGRLTVSDTLADGTDEWGTPFVNFIYAQRGATDVVMAEEINFRMRDEPKQDTVNIFNDVIWGVKSFADGTKRMLQVKVAA